MRKNARRVLVATTAVVALVAPAARAEAPVVRSAEVFGDAQPQIDPVAARRLFANSRPFGMGVAGLAHVRGNATPGSTVRVTATDGVHSVAINLRTEPRDDPNGDVTAGDFSGALEITELGVHIAGGEPGSSDPAHWGGAEIVFDFFASISGVESPGVSRRLTKFAGTPGDVTPPGVDRQTWPPRNWCHLSGSGFTGLLFGDARGKCADPGTGSDPPALPDPTWVACAPWPGVGAPLNSDRSLCARDPARSVPAGEALVSGVADDLPFAAYGVGSEIGDITITVRQGEKAVLGPYRSILRYGPRASWGRVVRINDLEPNYPTGEPYVVVVEVRDAWGNLTETSSPPITVYPW